VAGARVDAEHPTPTTDNGGSQAVTVFTYWSRWITARRLARMRVVDPQWIE